MIGDKCKGCGAALDLGECRNETCTAWGRRPAAPQVPQVPQWQPGDRVVALEQISYSNGYTIGEIRSKGSLGTVQPGSSFDKSVPTVIDGKVCIGWDGPPPLGKADASGGGIWTHTKFLGRAHVFDPHVAPHCTVCLERPGNAAAAGLHEEPEFRSEQCPGGPAVGSLSSDPAPPQGDAPPEIITDPVGYPDGRVEVLLDGPAVGSEDIGWTWTGPDTFAQSAAPQMPQSVDVDAANDAEAQAVRELDHAAAGAAHAASLLEAAPASQWNVQRVRGEPESGAVSPYSDDDPVVLIYAEEWEGLKAALKVWDEKSRAFLAVVQARRLRGGK